MKEMIDAYLACALWSSTNGDNGDVPFDRDYGIEDIAPESRLAAARECGDFLIANADIINRHEISLESVGHDFWLSRNGHGAGFWDRGYGPDGDVLSERADACGGRYLYAGDDGLVYIE